MSSGPLVLRAPLFYCWSMQRDGVILRAINYHTWGDAKGGRQKEFHHFVCKRKNLGESPNMAKLPKVVRRGEGAQGILDVGSKGFPRVFCTSEPCFAPALQEAVRSLWARQTCFRTSLVCSTFFIFAHFLATFSEASVTFFITFCQTSSNASGGSLHGSASLR